MYNSKFTAIAIVSLAVIAGGYIWLNALNTHDFNFAPAFIIMAGAVTLLVGVTGLITGYVKKQRSKI